MPIQFANRVNVICRQPGTSDYHSGQIHAQAALRMLARGQVSIEQKLSRRLQASDKVLVIREVFVTDLYPREEDSLHQNSSKTTFVETKRVRRCNSDGEPGHEIAARLHCHKRIHPESRDLYGVRVGDVTLAPFLGIGSAKRAGHIDPLKEAAPLREPAAF
jgi:hypothetical protein